MFKEGPIMKLIKEYELTHYKRQVYGGLKTYLCDCGHLVNIPVYQKEVKCIYCGKVKAKV